MDQMDILSTLESNYGTNSAIETLMQVDYVLDKLNVYAYANWLDGEVVDGPHIEPYWVTVTLLYPYKMMPDPAGAERVINWGGRVFYAKDTLITAAKLVTPDDSEGTDGADELRPGQPRTRKIERPVWLVTVELPRDSMDSMTADQQEIEDTSIDNDAVEEAYDDGLEDQA